MPLFTMRGIAPILAGSSASTRLANCWIGAAIAVLIWAGVTPPVAGNARELFVLVTAGIGLWVLLRNTRSEMVLIDGKLRRTYFREAFELAEKHAGIGRWRFDPVSQRQSWSSGLCRKHGVRSGEPADPGTLAVLESHKSDRKPFRFEVEVERPDGSDAVLRIFARNQFDALGKVIETYGVVIDVTTDYGQLQQVEAQRAHAQELANTDPLTGLPNRRSAMASIDRLILECRQNEVDLSLVVLDLDHFKDINDHYGHQAGDEVLKRVALIATGLVREQDVFARIGGEEFLWIMPGASPMVVELTSERLRRAIEQGSGGGGVPGVTVSIGYASCDAVDSCLTLFARADAALYEAKNAGRNQVKKAA